MPSAVVRIQVYGVVYMQVNYGVLLQVYYDDVPKCFDGSGRVPWSRFGPFPFGRCCGRRGGGHNGFIHSLQGDPPWQIRQKDGRNVSTCV